jgi:NitT/TauT family transport system ATP-binding protein
MMVSSSQTLCDDARSAIRLIGIGMSFTNGARPLEVLHNVNLTIGEGAIVGLLGASGSGKSTLLNIISGIIKPTRGQVCLCGAPSQEFNDWRTISYMFQEERLLPWRTAIRNVEFALEAGAMARAERARRAREVLELVNLHGFEDAYPYQLSGGMRSRVALARSLVTEPRILLMDEPFSRLDAQTRSLMHAELLRVHQLKRMTIVFVTHDVEEAVILADQVAVMSPRPGTIREIVDVVLRRPRDIIDPQVTKYIQKLRALI